MGTLLRLSIKEIANNRRFSAFFVLNLALGLLGFAALDAFKSSLERSLDERSRYFLSADLSVSARRELKDGELETIRSALPPGTREGRVIELYSMALAKSGSRLVEIRAVDETYPFYGEVALSSGEIIRCDSQRDIESSDQVWVDPSLALQMKLEIGDKIKLGSRKFKISARVENDTASAWRGVSLAPRVYIGLSRLEATGLVAAESTATYRKLFRLPEGSDLQAVIQALNEGLEDPAVTVTSHRNASEQIGRVMGYLNDYLGLVSLAALFLAGLGAAYLFRSFLARRMTELAILMSLGLTRSKARNLFLLQLSVLGAMAALASLAVSAPLLAVAGAIVGESLSFEMSPAISLRSVAIVLAVGTLGSVLICLPLLSRLKDLKPQALFQENPYETIASDAKGFFSQIPAALPAIVVYWALAIWQSNSFKVGSLFFGLFVGSALLLMGAGFLGMQLIERVSKRGSLDLRLTLRNLYRARFSTLSCFLAISLGTLLINLIPQIQNTIQAEIEEPQGTNVPSLFLFDIQDDQVDPLRNALKERSLSLSYLSPLVRARLLTVNGVAFERTVEERSLSTREQQQEQRTRNRGYNLTYREQLADSESIVDGKPFSGRYEYQEGVPAEISLETRFADRLGVGLGDVLIFDVQGIQVPGRVINLRKVRWTSFQPNFFIVFQPGTLEDAPKTFLAAIPRLDDQSKARLQNELVERFPNISILDVEELVSKLMGVFRQMSWAIRWMALLSLLAGLVVLFSIANHQASTRKRETSLMKVLGAPLRRIQAGMRLEFGLIGLAASSLGAVTSLGVSVLIGKVLFDGAGKFSLLLPMLSTALVTVASVIVAEAATRKNFARKPLDLLQRDD